MTWSAQHTFALENVCVSLYVYFVCLILCWCQYFQACQFSSSYTPAEQLLEKGKGEVVLFKHTHMNTHSKGSMPVSWVCVLCVCFSTGWGPNLCKTNSQWQRHTHSLLKYTQTAQTHTLEEFFSQQQRTSSSVSSKPGPFDEPHDFLRQKGRTAAAWLRCLPLFYNPNLRLHILTWYLQTTRD